MDMSETTKTNRICRYTEDVYLRAVTQAAILSAYAWMKEMAGIVAGTDLLGEDANHDRVYVRVYLDGDIEYAYSAHEPKKTFGRVEVETVERFTDTRPFKIDRATGNLF